MCSFDVRAWFGGGVTGRVEIGCGMHRESMSGDPVASKRVGMMECQGCPWGCSVSFYRGAHSESAHT